MTPTRHLFRFLILHKYQALFPIAVIEGPIITIISGILISLGYLSFAPTFLIVFAGDLISDPFLYAVGRFGRTIAHKITFIKISEERIQKLEQHYEKHPLKTMIAGKLSYGLGSVFMIASGAAKMPLKKFIGYISSINAIKSSVLLFIGYYFGKAALRIGVYMPYYAMAVVVIFLITYAIIRIRQKNGLPLNVHS